MTKQHSIAIADWIRNARRMGLTDYTDDVVGSIANFLTTQNPCFNRALWLDYVNGKCGPNGGFSGMRVGRY